MTVIDTTTSTSGLRYNNGRHLARTSTGRLWSGFNNGSSLEFWYSDDDGATWTQNTSASITATATAGFSFFIDIDDHAHVVYQTGGNSTYRRMASISTGTSWAAAYTISASYDSFPDIVAFRDGASWIAAVAVSEGTSTIVYLLEAVDSSPSVLQQFFITDNEHPSIDFRHTGDGKTIASSTPSIYVAGHRAANLRFVKITFSGGTWTAGTARLLDTAGTKSDHVSLAFDGTRPVIAYAESAVVYIAERDESDTTTTLRTPTALSDGTVTNLSLTYDVDKNIYLWAVGDTSDDVKRIKYDRSGGTWDGSWTTVHTGDVLADSLSLKRGYSDATIEATFLDGTGSPYDVVYESLTLNTAPNAPGSLSPDGSTTIDKDVTQRFSWVFDDIDAGDSQSEFDLRYRVVGAGTWTDTNGVTPNEFSDIAGGTFAAGDYEWQVRTYDAAGLVGPYSASAFFTAASSPSGPTITDPINAGTVNTDPYTVVWSAPSQDAYQVRTVADDGAGSPDTGTVYQDTGTVEVSGARSRSIAFDTNARDEHVQVRIRVGGLWSTYSSVQVSVSYVAVAAPTLAIVADDANGGIGVTFSNPTPGGGGEPAASSNELHVRVASGGRADLERTVNDDGIRIAEGIANDGAFTDWAAASGVDYEYRGRAIGANGTRTFSAWS